MCIRKMDTKSIKWDRSKWEELMKIAMEITLKRVSIAIMKINIIIIVIMIYIVSIFEQLCSVAFGYV